MHPVDRYTYPDKNQSFEGFVLTGLPYKQTVWQVCLSAIQYD
jgi:hypothetical protein